MFGGPQPLTRAERLALVDEIAARVRQVCGDQLLALGVYGSVARGTDGPYSDIEMLVVLRSAGEDYVHEWCAGPWKAEVDFLSADMALREAARVEGRWPLTHGAWLHIRPLHDPTGFFETLRQAVLSQPEEAFRAAIRELIVGDIYEHIGKLRNARARGVGAELPLLAVSLAQEGAYLIGLARRACYSGAARLFEESLAFPDRPAGYDALCAAVMAGELSDPERVGALCEGFWAGVERWAAEHGVGIVEGRRIPF